MTPGDLKQGRRRELRPSRRRQAAPNDSPDKEVTATASITRPRNSAMTSCAKATYFTRLDFTDSTEHTHREGGKVVVDRSEVLIAVCDGRAARGLGGTADVVAYVRQCGTHTEGRSSGRNTPRAGVRAAQCASQRIGAPGGAWFCRPSGSRGATSPEAGCLCRPGQLRPSGSLRSRVVSRSCGLVRTAARRALRASGSAHTAGSGWGRPRVRAWGLSGSS